MRRSRARACVIVWIRGGELSWALSSHCGEKERGAARASSARQRGGSVAAARLRQGLFPWTRALSRAPPTQHNIQCLELATNTPTTLEEALAPSFDSKAQKKQARQNRQESTTCSFARPRAPVRARGSAHSTDRPRPPQWPTAVWSRAPRWRDEGQQQHQQQHERPHRRRRRRRWRCQRGAASPSSAAASARISSRHRPRSAARPDTSTTT